MFLRVFGAARKPGWTALVFPQIPLGACGSNELGGHFVFPGTYAVRPATLRALFMDLAAELREQGFRWVLVVHVHGAPLHNRALDQASDFFHDSYGGRMAHLRGLVPVLGGWGQALQGLNEAEKAEEGVSLHAGIDETSLLLHLRPDLVSPAYREAPVVTGRHRPRRSARGERVGVAREEKAMSPGELRSRGIRRRMPSLRPGRVCRPGSRSRPSAGSRGP